MSDSIRVTLVLVVGLVAVGGSAHAQSNPSGRVGRLAYMQGTVSFHDSQQDSWSPAAVNTPLTTGDSLWTEPNGHDEISVAGTRVRMDGDTQLDMLAIDDSQVRLQLDQGRLDVKAISSDNSQPYQIVTPRGTVTLEQQGDYYIHAGSTDDPTLLGVRAGAAQIQTPSGQVLAVRAGEVGKVSGDSNALQLQTVQSAPPVLPAYWAPRDQQITYDQPQYVTAALTGYEDLNAYGTWNSDPEYGEVWSPNSPPAGWQPYGTGSWSYVGQWGWTWVDAQPWGFAPYHYGRWAQRDNRWLWVPPQRDASAIYAPALVAFVGGTELGIALGEQGRSPVGWFPLGPREPYVPPYTADQGYYRRINASAGVQDAVLNDRWQRAGRHEALTGNQPNDAQMNRRFAKVVSADDFVHSRPVAQAALKVSADKLASMPVASVSAPPAPGRSIAEASPQQAPADRANDPNARTQGNAQGTLPTAQTRFGGMESISKPAVPASHPNAPGPKIASLAPGAPNTAGKPAVPPLTPRTGAAPPQLQGERTPVTATPQHPAQASPAAPQAYRTEPSKPNEPARPEVQRPAEATPQAQHSQAQQTHASAPPSPPHQAVVPRPEGTPPPLVHPSSLGPSPQPPHPAADLPHPSAPQQAHAPAPAPQQAHAPAPPAAPHPAAAASAPPKEEKK
jgi:hypothetical protein